MNFEESIQMASTQIGNLRDKIESILTKKSEQHREFEIQNSILSEKIDQKIVILHYPMIEQILESEKFLKQELRLKEQKIEKNTESS